MQTHLSYYPDPGIMTDAIKIISIKLNDKIFLKPSYSICSFDEEEITYHLQEGSHFPAISKELLLFFYKNSDQKANFMTGYLTEMLCSTFTTFSLSSFHQSFSDHNAIKKALFEYYLGSSDYMNSNFEFVIRSNTTLPDPIKFYLLGFCINPASYTQLLLATLDSYCSLIIEKYRCQRETFELDLSALKSYILSTYPKDSPSILSRPLAYSYCSIIRDYLCFNHDPKQNWIIVGSKFADIVSNLEHAFQMPFEIEKVCNALGDNSRMRIIQYLHTHPHQSTKEIQNALSLPQSSLHHHIKILQESQLIKQQRKKAGNIYSLNSSVFKEITAFFAALSDESN